MKILLPVQLSPVSRRKDKSVVLKLETREMNHEEILTLMSMEGSEAWMSLAFNQEQLPEAPEENAEIEGKSPATRLRNVMYILYKQAVEDGKFVGVFQTYYAERMEKVIERLKEKIDTQ